MIGNIGKVSIDSRLLDDGIPVMIETDDGTATLYVRPADRRNVAFAAAREELNATRGEDESLTAFTVRVWPVLLARACVVGWEGITDEAGEALPCEEKLVLELFERHDDAISLVADAASDLEGYRLGRDTKSD